VRRAITEKELLSIVFAINTSHRDYLIANPFVLHTDAKALKYLQDQKFKNSKIFRWSILLSQFNFKIEHIPGKDNPADYGSRFIQYLHMISEEWYPQFYR